jgi:hypothetical protein
MQTSRCRAILMAAAVGIVISPINSHAQPRGPAAGEASRRVTVVPGPDYRADPLAQALLGTGWRQVWLTPVDAPVLDLRTFAGGLKLDERGGGFQSLTLHLSEENGWREYRFRSVDKFPNVAMPSAIRGTTIGDIIQDQVSTLFPAAPLLVPPLMEAVGALHVKPTLVVMGDDPRLGVYRDTVVGMLGTMELKGEEAPDDQPGFGGSRKIKGTEGFLEDLEESREHRLDEGSFLAARLIDFLINDTDRSPDNFDWARFGDDGAYSWRPIARDRDMAFIDARGLMNRFVARRLHPRYIEFGNRYSLTGLTHSSSSLDRRLLQRLTREEFARIAIRARDAITNDVIDNAIAGLPRSWRDQTTAPGRLRAVLRARRDALPEIAMRFYMDLASEVDVYGTKQRELADVVRHGDGRVTVTITDPSARGVVVAVVPRDDGHIVTASDGAVVRSNDRSPYFVRTFSPAETNEIRLYLGDGADSAVVRGVATNAIVVRVIGGEGNDVLVDAAGGATLLYDADGNNRFVTTRGTRVDRRSWTPPKRLSGLKFGQDWRPDWGRSAGWTPAMDYGSGAGVILGLGYDVRSYGFRRLPHHWEAGAALLVGTGNGRVALATDLDYRAENSPLAFRLSARASQLDALRFHGYGNNTDAVSSDLNLVDQNTAVVEPALVWHFGWRKREGQSPFHDDSVSRVGLRPMVGRLEAGPILSWIDPEPHVNSPLVTTSAPGRGAFGHMGARLGLELDRTDSDPIPSRGWKLHAEIGASPAVWGQASSFTSSRATGALYVPLFEGGTHLALRAGGALASGGAPVQYAPALGGWTTLRGHSWRRFTGDAALDGSTELRVPVGTLNLLLRWDVGVFGLADVGRVWFDGQSDGGWHTGVGGGLWLTALGRTVSVAYARGEEHRFYLKGGLF